MEPAHVDPSELPAGFTAAGNDDAAGSAEQMKKQAVQEQKQTVLEQACTQEALARLGRIRLVKPDKAAKVENSIVSMAMQGKLPGKINEGKLIEILERGSMREAAKAGAPKGINIQRKRYALDSDDEDDDDDEDLL